MRRLALVCTLLACLAAASSAQAATYWVWVNGISFSTYDATAALVNSPTGDPTVDPGDTILWEWGSSGSHDVVSGNLNTGTPDGKFNTNGLRGNGATFTYTTAASSASYTYFCTPHRASGMKGTIKATGTTNEPPVAAFNVTPLQPQPGDTITLDATPSSDPEGTLVAKYRWDLDGNGVYETTTTTPSTTTSFQEGNHVVGLRVFDGKSAVTTKQQTITVQYPTPEVTTGSATNVTTTGATLAGTVDPNGTAATYVFEYGTDTTYGTSTPAADAGQGASAVPVSTTITGLTPGTQYHYRVVATNLGGTTAGADATFTTPAPPPVPTQTSTSTTTTPNPTTPTDTAPPAVSFVRTASQSIASGVLSLNVTPQEDSRLSLKALIRIPGAKAIRVAGRVIAAAAGQPAKVKLRLSKTIRARVRRAIAAGKVVRAKLTLTALDAAGNTATKSMLVRLR